MSSWIKLFRDINKHWIWQNSDYLKWWLDILLEVNHAPAKVVINNKIYDCNRGEKLYSLDTWAHRWGTNKSKVRRFLQLLQNDNMIVLKSETQTTRLIVCKYDTYQDMRNADETQMKRKRNASETHLTPIEEGKEEEYLYSLQEYKYSFVKIKDFAHTLNSFSLNKSYFYIAYRFWELWWQDNKNKTLKDAQVIKWYDAIRLIIEVDKQKIDRLIAVYEYFKKCQQKESGFDSFWFENIKSVASFRKKDKEGVYYLDKIIDRVNKKIEGDSAFRQLIFSQIEKFKKYESSKLS